MEKTKSASFLGSRSGRARARVPGVGASVLEKPTFLAPCCGYLGTVPTSIASWSDNRASKHPPSLWARHWPREGGMNPPGLAVVPSSEGGGVNTSSVLEHTNRYGQVQRFIPLLGGGSWKLLQDPGEPGCVAPCRCLLQKTNSPTHSPILPTSGRPWEVHGKLAGSLIWSR